MTKAYLIGHITVKENDKWQEYRSKVPATLEPWQGCLVFRGSLSAILCGSHQHSDTVVIEFPDMQALNEWYTSPQYQALIPLRQEAAEMDLLTYEA
ncbi:MAG: DUF1330 domain-containing protein [Candidatus Thiodiazotropha sp. 'RUGA']|nr:DUF1330 domain-containing protein [Candidatus Thiodiazotropha sp. 'RUGA']